MATTTAACPAIPDVVAVIVAEPLATAFATPDELTVATAVLDDDQAMVTPLTTLPEESRATAENCMFCPAETSVSAPGVTSTCATWWPGGGRVGAGAVLEQLAATATSAAAEAMAENARL